MTEPFIPGEDIDEIAAQYVQLRAQNAKPDNGKLVSKLLQLRARLIHRYGREEAVKRIQLAQESWNLLTPKESPITFTEGGYTYSQYIKTT